MGKSFRLLDIYDTSDWAGRQQGSRDGNDVYSIDADSVASLVRALNKIVSDGLTFEAALFTTHGSPGVIYLGDEWITAHDLYKWFAAGHYERLFPHVWTKIYFDGCNVAAGDGGWVFLEAAVRTFCRKNGGFASGWTSTGFGIPSWLPVYGSHTVHPSGHVRSVELSLDPKGGGSIRRWGDED